MEALSDDSSTSDRIFSEVSSFNQGVRGSNYSNLIHRIAVSYIKKLAPSEPPHESVKSFNFFFIYFAYYCRIEFKGKGGKIII